MEPQAYLKSQSCVETGSEMQEMETCLKGSCNDDGTGILNFERQELKGQMNALINCGAQICSAKSDNRGCCVTKIP